MRDKQIISWEYFQTRHISKYYRQEIDKIKINTKTIRKHCKDIRNMKWGNP